MSSVTILQPNQFAKFLKQILVPLVGNTQYTVKNSSEFVELISSIKLGESDSQVSFICLLRFHLKSPKHLWLIESAIIAPWEKEQALQCRNSWKHWISVYNHRFLCIMTSFINRFLVVRWALLCPQ